MNTLKSFIFTALALMLLVSPLSAFANFKSAIIDSCSTYQQDSKKEKINACKSYIDGFIDSSLITDDAVIKPKAQISQQAEPKSDYLKRAYQTRLLTTSSMLDNEQAHEFCIPRELDRQSIASKVAQSIDIQKLEHKTLKEVLLETLIINFPCQQ
ncbi:Rap1a/Tai family immunity protein [Thalassotalea piscium]|uniref:Rap1a immunity protein domain-containing protein n=1 Tax=Thalassotalea piscium TaxID=1230533 RepID=A0A7X0TSD3_9GAMM|nr:Rap1a/Tai family immunity protein [Thalassotalea piscium]MBB6542011.1 hypothetical protein [Thalassotalea piscium]